MFKKTTFGKLFLVLLAIIIATQADVISSDFIVDSRPPILATITAGEPNQNTQSFQSKLTISNGKVSHHNHQKIVFDGPEEEIVMKINLQFDKELKHFRIKQLNYANEDAEG